MLPRPLSTFMGRQPERRVLLASVREHPLTTVVGPPGVGKTRLAVEVARELANEYPDRCWFVDLAPVGAAELVAPTVLGAIGAPSHERDALADVARAISSEPTLLVIDNCEHVGTTVAALCVALLDRCTELRILATSRSELGVAGERVAAVRPFDTAPARGRSDAVELFYDRANARGAELGRDDATAEEVTRICVRLDGLPLAIELAAARARVLTLAVLDQLLVAPLDVLTSEPARSSLPQRSLQASIEWSHRLCTEGEQRAWEALSVFAGSFGLAPARAVLAVAGADRTPLDLLDALVSRSLLLTVADDGGQVRYRMLETLRAFAGDRLGRRPPRPAGARRLVRRHRHRAGDLVDRPRAGGEAERRGTRSGQHPGSGRPRDRTPRCTAAARPGAAPGGGAVVGHRTPGRGHLLAAPDAGRRRPGPRGARPGAGPGGHLRLRPAAGGRGRRAHRPAHPTHPGLRRSLCAGGPGLRRGLRSDPARGRARSGAHAAHVRADRGELPQTGGGSWPLGYAIGAIVLTATGAALLAAARRRPRA